MLVKFILASVVLSSFAKNPLDDWPTDGSAPPPMFGQFGHLGRGPGTDPHAEEDTNELAEALKRDDSNIQVMGFAKQKAALQSQLQKLQHEVNSMTPQNAEQVSQAMEQQDSTAQSDIEHLNANAENAEQRLQQQAALQSMWLATKNEQSAEHDRENQGRGYRFRSRRGVVSGPPPPPPPPGGGGHFMRNLFFLGLVGGAAYFVSQKHGDSVRHSGYDTIGARGGGGSGGFQLQGAGGAGASVTPASPATATSAGSATAPGL